MQSDGPRARELPLAVMTWQIFGRQGEESSLQMREESRACPLCEAMRERVEVAGWEYVQIDTWAGVGVETGLEELQCLQAELEKTEAEYREARADLERHHHEHCSA